MKKQQRIIELRRLAKLEVAEIKTKIAFAYSEAEKKRSEVLRERAYELKGLEAGSTERYDVLAKYRAKMACVNDQLAASVAQLKYEIQQTKSECERQCAAADDDPKPEKEQPQQQETVYCDGSEHSARIVARRLINKMPHIPKEGALFVNIICNSDGCYFVSLSAQGKRQENYVSTTFSNGFHSSEGEAEFLSKARRTLDNENNDNSHVAEPLSRALDAIFGGNPVKEVDNLISDTVKDRKDGKNE